MPQIDGLVWIVCGLGFLLVTTVAAAIVWSALRVAGRDDELQDRMSRRRHGRRD